MTESVTTRRQDLAFQVAYSLFLEKMAYRWYGRIDKILSFLLLLSGMAVVADSLPTTTTGFAVAILTAWQLIYSPATKSATARATYLAYGQLFNQLGNLTDDEIAIELNKLSDKDSDAPACLEMPAYCLAGRRLNVPVTNLPALTLEQRLAQWFCGGA